MIVQRALEIGDAQGLQAVSLRRIASDLGVTPMALYRHVHDKADLYKAMVEATMVDVDLAAGMAPTMTWQEKLRQELENTVRLLTARPVTLPLQIAYQGPPTPAIAGTLEASLGVLLEAGFRPHDAVSLARVLPMLIAGLLLLYRQDPGDAETAEERARLRRVSELQVLELPADEFPNMRRHAQLLAETFYPDTDQWLNESIDLMIAGLEERLARQATKDA